MDRSTAIGAGFRFARILALLIFVISSATSLGAVDVPAVIDFDAALLPTGTIVDSIQGLADGSELVGPIGVVGTLPSNPFPNSAVIFDSAMRTGGDSDLGTPNGDFGGPGTGAGGEMGQPFQNDQAHLNIMIVAEDLVDSDGDGLVDDPDDGTEFGMMLEFDFTTITEPFVPDDVTVHSITTIDAEGTNPGAVMLYDAAGALISETPLVTTGDNGVTTVGIGLPGEGVSGVARMVVVLNASSAIDDIEFTVTSRDVGDQLWFLNGGDGTISIISLDGIPLETVDVPGQSGPTGIAVSPEGITWVAFNGSNAVVRFDTGGNVIDIIPVGNGPTGVAVDTDSNAWVSCTADSTLWKIGADGSVLYGGAGAPPFVGGSLGGAIPVPAGPTGVAVDILDNVIVACTDAGIVEKHNADGDLVWSVFGAIGSKPTGIAVDRQAFAWVTDPVLGRVERLASDGALSLEFDGFPGADVAAITVRGAGEVWVCGEGDGTLRRYVPGVAPQVFPIGGSPSGISTDGLGNLWITDRVAGTVSRYDSNGAQQQSIAIGPGPGFLGDAFGLVPANVLRPLADFDGEGFRNGIEVDVFTNPYDEFSTPTLLPTYVDPVLDLTCGADIQDVFLAWTNPPMNDFVEIRVLRNDVLAATLPASAESYGEPVPLEVGIYRYRVVGADVSGNVSLAEQCTVAVGPGDLENVYPIEVPGFAVNIFGITGVPNPAPGMPVTYVTDPGNDHIYGLDEDFQPVLIIPSPFTGIAPTTGIVFVPGGNGGLGSLLVAAGSNGDPLQDATLIEIALDGTPLGDPYILVRPAPLLLGNISIKGGLGGLTQTRDSGDFTAVSPENCELFTFRTDPPAGLLPPTEIVIIEAASAVHPQPGFGLNGVDAPVFADFGDMGGSILSSNLTADGFEIARLRIEDGEAIIEASVLPFAAAEQSENVFGEFVVRGDRVYAVGITTSSVYEFGNAFFTRGDANHDGNIDVADPVEILMACFLGAAMGNCVDAYDADDNGSLGVGDAVFMLSYLFTFVPPYAPEPPPPFQTPGPDPTLDSLPCL